MHTQTHWQTITRLCVVLGLLSSPAGCATAATETRAGAGQRAAKIAPELIALHDEYASYLASGRNQPFRSANPLLQIVGRYVVVDAVASGDGSVLQGDLLALGMLDSVRVGRIVSGQLPITSLPALAELTSLNFMRAASAVMHKGRPDILRGSP
jgi:hypothetical protein